MPSDAFVPDYTALYGAAPCGLVVTTRSGLLIEANATFCSWLGYDRDQLVDRRRFQDVLSMGSRIYHQTHWYPLLEMQGAVNEINVELTKQDGDKLPMIMNGVKREGKDPSLMSLR